MIRNLLAVTLYLCLTGCATQQTSVEHQEARADYWEQRLERYYTVERIAWDVSGETSLALVYYSGPDEPMHIESVWGGARVAKKYPDFFLPLMTARAIERRKGNPDLNTISNARRLP